MCFDFIAKFVLESIFPNFCFALNFGKILAYWAVNALGLGNARARPRPCPQHARPAVFNHGNMRLHTDSATPAAGHARARPRPCPQHARPAVFNHGNFVSDTVEE